MKRLLACLLVLPLLLTPSFAADHAAVNEDVWPSQNDVAQTPGNGKKLLENQWANLAASAFIVNNYSLSGLTVPGTSVSLNINVAAGAAYLAGRWVSIPAATSVTASASTTNYVFLKLTRDGSNLATGVAFEVNTTGTAPADSTPIAILTAGGSTITATTDKRILPMASEVLSSGTSWTFPAGITRVYVEIYGAGGGGGGGGEGWDSAPADGNNGGTGGTGGTTTFGALSAAGGVGGAGGSGGKVGGGAWPGSPVPIGASGTASGGTINLTGKGLPGGPGGQGGGSNVTVVTGAHGHTGAIGGFGGYSAGAVSGAVGSSVSYAIGAGGTAGSAGSGGGAGTDGNAGSAGPGGRIIIRY